MYVNTGVFSEHAIMLQNGHENPHNEKIDHQPEDAMTCNPHWGLFVNPSNL